jgi:lipopolysaccharide transport system ATP-binding protein
LSQVAIRVEGLAKRYRIGAARTRHDRLSDAVVKGAAARIRGWRGLGSSSGGAPFVWALKDVSFAVNEGDALGVVGRNGSGKSTLLKVLSRITEPTVGRAEIRGRVGSLLEVGTGFHPDLTGRENVYLNGAILGMRRREIARRFDEIVAFAEAGRFLDTQVKHYSSGMQVRLAFAVAAHLDTEVLFLDEVLAVGDFAFREKCLARLREARSEGRTILLVSHDMDSVQDLCSHAMLLREGEVGAWGEPSEVIAAYTHQPATGDPS